MTSGYLKFLNERLAFFPVLSSPAIALQVFLFVCLKENEPKAVLGFCIFHLIICTSSIISLQWHQTSAALLEPSHTERTDSLPPVLSKEFFLSFHWELCRKHSRTFLYSAETFNYKFLVGFQLVYCITQWQSKNLVSLRPPTYAKSLGALKLTLYVCP